MISRVGGNNEIDTAVEHLLTKISFIYILVKIQKKVLGTVKGDFTTCR